jgi:hypothetical protein
VNGRNPPLGADCAVRPSPANPGVACRALLLLLGGLNGLKLPDCADPPREPSNPGVAVRALLPGALKVRDPLCADSFMPRFAGIPALGRSMFVRPRAEKSAAERPPA